MRVVVNALHLHPGETGGAETYLLELIKALASMENWHQYSILIWPDSEELMKSLCKSQVDNRTVTGSPAAHTRPFAYRS